MGTSGSLLLRNYGEVIDRHSHVLRADAPEKFESSVGITPGVHVLVDTPEDMKWITHKQRTILATPAAAVKFDLAATEMTSVYIIHPNFTQHLVENYASSQSPSALLYALALALNTCHSVTLYGASPMLHMPAVPARYYDPCASSVGRALEDWPVVALLARIGLITYGEPCVLECGTDGNRSSCVGCQQLHGVFEGELSLPSCPGGST